MVKNKKSPFKLVSQFGPCGDQPQAISQIVGNFKKGLRGQTLLGVTGSGKTFTMANTIAQLGKKTLILAHNKTLAAQLYSEFKAFFPDNCVEYFVSYYDYYQPEAYVPGSDTYIEKDASINDEIDKLRHGATQNLLERDDVIVVASVSCIYGIGAPAEYEALKCVLFVDEKMDREAFLKKLVSIQYTRNDIDFSRGNFRVRGDIVEIFPASEDSDVVRVEFFDDIIEGLFMVDPLRGKVLKSLNKIIIYPKSHYVVGEGKLAQALVTIKEELRGELIKLTNEGKLLEGQRLEQRTLLDIEMLEEMGFCSGIENYSRHLTGGLAGMPPPTLIDYFKKNFLLIVDESHMTIPQVGAMYRGDFSRKSNLVNHGFRMPSALDNRPLNFLEFEAKIDQILFVSATPGKYELEQTGGEYTEQIIRPTGLLDPIIEVRDAKTQVDDLLLECKKTIKEGFKILVTTLTKKLAEELTAYYQSIGMKIRYLHSDIKTIERMEIIRDLRLGEFDILVGINLLREGLDIPEVALVGILDADKEGFLRSDRALIQTIGRAARNDKGRAILYAYKETGSMKRAIDETARRRIIQESYNQKNGITPRPIKKSVSPGIIEALRGAKGGREDFSKSDLLKGDLTVENISLRIDDLTLKMKQSAKDLDFERAAKIRDEILELKEARLICS